MKVLGLVLLCISAASASFRAGYVIGGEDAEITDWPFMVSLQSGGSHFCGAVLLDPINILTAAHCVQGSSPGSIQIMVGSNSQSDPGTTYDLTGITLHPDYNFPEADIAVLYVDGQVDADGVTVDFVVLAESDAEDFVGNDCQIAGWGQTDDDGSPDILQWAPVNVISVDDCQDDWGSQMSEAQICIRDDDGEFGACFGDSGGPMTCIDESGNRVLTGTTSGGSGSCDTSIAAYYARTSFYWQWVQENLQF